jgi:hypothetical protein
VAGLATAGAALLVWSAVIHLELWSAGYRAITTIGPLFLIISVADIVLALLAVALRWLVVLAAGAAMLAGTAVGLLISANGGLFGYQESLAVPYATLSLYVEFTGAAVLLAGAAALVAAPARKEPYGNPFRAPFRH